MPYFGSQDPGSYGWTFPPAAGDIVPLIYAGVPFSGDGGSVGDGVHRLAWPLFKRALDLLVPALPNQRLLNPGCWGGSTRPITGGTTPSYHSWRLAIDVNAPDNPYLSPDQWNRGVRSAPHTLPDNTGALVRPLGLSWGGDWTGLRDYMHLEVHVSPAEAKQMGDAMALLCFDYSSGFPSPASIRAAGGGSIIRYVGTRGRNKNLTKTEADLMQAGGIAIALVYEDDVGTALQGFNRGAQDARAAIADAQACGVEIRAIYAAIDFDAQPSQYAAIDDYFRGWASVLGKSKLGAYGGYAVIKHLLDAGLIAWGWQTRAWSGGNVDPRIHLYQGGQTTVGGIAVDINYPQKDNGDFGQSPFAGTEEPVDEEDAKVLWDHPAPWPARGWDDVPHAQPQYAMWQYAQGANLWAARTALAVQGLVKTVTGLAAQVTALQAAVAQGAAGDVDYARIEEAAAKGAADVVQHLRFGYVDDDPLPPAVPGAPEDPTPEQPPPGS